MAEGFARADAEQQGPDRRLEGAPPQRVYLGWVCASLKALANAPASTSASPPPVASLPSTHCPGCGARVYPVGLEVRCPECGATGTAGTTASAGEATT